MLTMYQKAFELGKEIPAELKPLVMAVLKNVAIPAAIENEQIRNQVAQEMEAESQQMAEQQPAIPMEPQQNNIAV
jgi:hypothetical protein